MAQQDMSVYYDALRNADKAGDKAGAQKLADYIASQGQAAKPVPTTAGQRAKSFVGGLNLQTAEQDPGFRAVEAGAVPEASAGAALKAVAKPVGSWLDKILEKVAPTAQQKAAQIFQKTASNPAAAKTAIDTAAKAKPLVKGVRQTTAAQAGDEGLLGLEKTVRNMPGASERLGREVAAPSNIARSNVVGALAGDDARLTALKGVRDSKTEALYRKADTAQVNVDPAFKKLMERPSMKKALVEARRIAKERGDPLQPGDLMKGEGKTIKGQPASKILDQFGKPIDEGTPASKALQVSGKGIHYLKLAYDKMLEATPTTALGRTERAGVAKSREALLNWAEDRIPEYKQARELYKQASRPINRMELMQKIQAKATSNATDAQGNKIITRNGYQNAVKQYRKELERTMSPVQLKHIDRIAQDLDMSERVNSKYITASGSETMRHANAASVLGRLTGGHGLTSAGTQLLAKVPGLRWLQDQPPEKVRELLVEAMLDPEAAKLLLEKPTTNTLTRLADKFEGYRRELAIPAGQTGRAALAPLNTGDQQ